MSSYLAARKHLQKTRHLTIWKNYGISSEYFIQFFLKMVDFCLEMSSAFKYYFGFVDVSTLRKHLCFDSGVNSLRNKTTQVHFFLINGHKSIKQVIYENQKKAATDLWESNVQAKLKPWTNRVPSRHKLKTWIYLRLRLARPCVHLRWLALT